MNRRSFFRMLAGALAAIPFVRKFAHREVPKPEHESTMYQLLFEKPKIGPPIAPVPTLWISTDKGSNWTKLGKLEEFNFTMKPIPVKANDRIEIRT